VTLPIEDRFALQQLLMRYTHALDYDELDTMAEIWTPDCEFNVDEPAFQARGRDQVVALLRETRQGFPRVRHVVTNCLVEAEPGGALVRSYLHILDLDTLAPTLFARYFDHCIATEDGWRIQRRFCRSEASPPATP